MASLTFALLCCVFVGILTVPSYGQTCVGVGSACNASCSAPGGPTACSDSHCDTTSYTCVDVASLGEACDNTGTGVGPDCVGDQVYYTWAYTCLSSSGVCGTNNDPLGPGDACDVSEKAVGNATNGGCGGGSVCTSGTCSSAGGDGASCTYGTGAPCDNGFYCSFTSGCLAMGGVGATCSFLAPCLNGLVCAGNGSCITPLTGAEGDKCSAGNIFAGPAVGAIGSTECQVGLACDSTSQTCVSVDSSKVGQPCSTAADCGTGYACVTGGSCSAPTNTCALTVSVWSDTVANAWLTYEQCLGTNGCSTAALNLAFSNLPFKGTAVSNCAQVSCFNEWTDFVNTWARTGPYTECAASTTAGPATTGSSMTMTMGTSTGSGPASTGQATQATQATQASTGSSTTTGKKSAGSVLSVSAVLAMIFALFMLA